MYRKVTLRKFWLPPSSILSAALLGFYNENGNLQLSKLGAFMTADHTLIIAILFVIVIPVPDHAESRPTAGRSPIVRQDGRCSSFNP